MKKWHAINLISQTLKGRRKGQNAEGQMLEHFAPIFRDHSVESEPYNRELVKITVSAFRLRISEHSTQSASGQTP